MYKAFKFSLPKYLLVLLPLFGCAIFKSDQTVPKKEYPVILYVSSQNGGYVDPVNILVKIDGERFVKQDFSCGTGHNHNEFKLMLTEGDHQFEIESSNGNAGLDVIFTVDKPLWLSLTYWGKNHFQLYISKGAFIFL